MLDWKNYEVEFEDGHVEHVEDTFLEYAAEQACANYFVEANCPDEFENVKVYCSDNGARKTFNVTVNREPQFCAEEV